MNPEERIQWLLNSDVSKQFQVHRDVLKMLMLSYPSRWRYDILRALDYFRSVHQSYDSWIDEALTILRKKQRRDRTWPVQCKHTGQSHIEMEKTGTASRWNTLRAMRVINYYGVSYD